MSISTSMILLVVPSLVLLDYWLQTSLCSFQSPYSRHNPLCPWILGCSLCTSLHAVLPWLQWLPSSLSDWQKQVPPCQVTKRSPPKSRQMPSWALHKAMGKLTTKTGLPKGNSAQVKARAEWANRIGSWDDDPPTLGEHLDETWWEAPVVLERNTNKAEERNEISCAFAVIHIQIIHNTCC